MSNSKKNRVLCKKYINKYAVGSNMSFINKTRKIPGSVVMDPKYT